MQSVTSDKFAVTLHPEPGFCVKSRAISDAIIRSSSSPDQPFHVDKGIKIFVNVTWDSNVPPPPPATDDEIVTAMHVDESNPQSWFVPVVLSDARQDSDKAGLPAIVFDCILNSSLKSRCLKQPDFKKFIIELAFQRIEAQTTLVLSRQIATPNIASKGKPMSRRAIVSTALFPPDHPCHQAPAKLVHGTTDHPSSAVLDKPPPKGILKTFISEPRIPTWSWAQQGPNIRITFDVPGVTRAVIDDATLDIEPRRIVLHIPDLYHFDLDLEALDAELLSVFGKHGTANGALELKRMRNLDVDGARAEWRVADETIVLVA